MRGVKDNHAIRRPPLTVPGPMPASYVTTGVYGSFELMARAHPRTQPVRSSSALCSATLWACLKRPTWISLALGDGNRALFPAFGFLSQDILLRFTKRLHYIGPQVQNYLAGLNAGWEECLPRWTVGVQNAD